MPANPPTGEYYHVKIHDAPKGSEYRVIVLSAEKGIKATYDVTKKRITSYMFDKDKWSQASANKEAEKLKSEGVTTEAVEDLGRQLFEDMKKEVLGLLE